MSYVFRDAIRQIFGACIDYYENRTEGTIFFEPDEDGVTYDQLAAMAELLGTTAINFRPGRQRSGCPTCGGDYESAEIRVTGVDFTRAVAQAEAR